jgi:hypothetical protein
MIRRLIARAFELWLKRQSRQIRAVRSRRLKCDAEINGCAAHYDIPRRVYAAACPVFSAASICESEDSAQRQLLRVVRSQGGSAVCPLLEHGDDQTADAGDQLP